jgi:hypothetical protein
MGAFFALPPAAVAVAMVLLVLACYFVLPPWIGLPIVLLVAPLPWYEERLQETVTRREAERERAERP